IPTHEPEQRHRHSSRSTPAARAAPSTSSRPFPQPYPSPQSPSSVTSQCRVLACKVSARSGPARSHTFYLGKRPFGRAMVVNDRVPYLIDLRVEMAPATIHAHFLQRTLWHHFLWHI